jgi:hypothetical protein
MVYIILRGRRFHIIVLKIHALKEDELDDMKDSFYTELEHVFSNDSGDRILNFPTAKNLTVKSTMFPHRNIHKSIGCFLMGKPTIRMTIF